MNIITPDQLRCLNTLVSKLRIDKEAKADMVNGFSSGRCSSSKDLFFDEAAAMIKHLKATDPHRPAMDKMKRKMMYYAHEMGWTKPGNAGKPVPDVERIDAWCLKFGSIKRKLDNYSYTELPKLVSQFEAVYKHFLKAI